MSAVPQPGSARARPIARRWPRRSRIRPATPRHAGSRAAAATTDQMQNLPKLGNPSRPSEWQDILRAYNRGIGGSGGHSSLSLLPGDPASDRLVWHLITEVKGQPAGSITRPVPTHGVAVSLVTKPISAALLVLRGHRRVQKDFRRCFVAQLVRAAAFTVLQTQRDAWLAQLPLLRAALCNRSGRIYLELLIPADGKSR